MASINYRLDDLRALLALQATGSFVRAAHQMNITQPAFSRRIAQLEAAVGGALVERTTRKVTMTPLGSGLVRRASPLLSQLDDTLLEIGRCARGESGRVTLACLTTVAHALLPQVLKLFRRRYPQVRLQLLDDTGQRVAQAVLSGEAEFGVGVLSGLPGGLYAEAVAEDPYVIAFAPGHPLQALAEVPWQSLQSYRVIALRPTSAHRVQLGLALEEEGISPPWFDEVEHLSSMLGLLIGGVGVGVLPRLALQSGARMGLRSRPLVGPAVVRSIGLLRRPDALLSEPAQFFWQLLGASLRSPARRVAQVQSAKAVQPRL